MKNGVVECSVCRSKLASPGSKTISRAYDDHKIRFRGSSKQRADKVFFIVDCILDFLPHVLIYMYTVNGKFNFSPIKLTECAKVIFATVMLLLQAWLSLEKYQIGERQMKNGVVKCSVCRLKLAFPGSKTISRAYDDHKIRVSSKQRALKVLLAWLSVQKHQIGEKQMKNGALKVLSVVGMLDCWPPVLLHMSTVDGKFNFSLINLTECAKVIIAIVILLLQKRYLFREDLVAVGGDIKEVKPPVLKPPPATKRPPVYLEGLSWDFITHFAISKGWDFITHFAPVSETVERPSSSSSSSSNNGCDEEEAGEEELEKEEMGMGDTADEAYSFTTNKGGSSSTLSNMSPIYLPGSIITSWQKGELLGRGSFGSVYEGISGDGDFFAVKEVSLLEQGSEAQECIQQLEGEIALLSQLQHPNIVRYRGTAKDGSNLYIFLELVTQGSLRKLYQRYQLRDSQVSMYTRHILNGLKYLHDKGFIHRDIKCANILVHASGVVKLADFGLAKVSKLNDIKSCKGTPFWMAPEVINPKRNDGYGNPADIWSLGCTVLEMLTRQIPYSPLEPVQALYSIGSGTLPSLPDTLSPDARDFILKCLNANPEQRPTAAELLNHPFVRRPFPSLGSGSGSGPGSPLLRRQG